MTPLDLGGMWLLGLLGSTHCVAMCSAFVVCLSARDRTNTVWYQAGRWLSYVILGAVMGGLGIGLRDFWIGRLVSVVLMALVGVALLGWSPGIGKFSGRLVGWLRPLLSVPSARSSLSLGGLTGFLPCGLLYAALARAAASANPLSGALLMAAFWLGTAPLLLAGGWLAPRLAGRRLLGWTRWAGVVVLIMAASTAVHGFASGPPPCPLCRP